MADPDTVDAGFRLLQEWSWDEARQAFERALFAEETPECLEGLGSAATWLDDAKTAIGARQRAYRLYLDRGDVESAARMAVGITDNILTFRGEWAAAAGWLRRARRVLAGREDSPVMGFVDLMAAFAAIAHEREFSKARALAERAVDHCRRLGDVNTEMHALALMGMATVSYGGHDEGMAMLDEATAAALAGDVGESEAAANICCVMVTACVRTRDLGRLREWAEHAMVISGRWGRKAPLFNYPRTECALALLLWGRWEEAEDELLGVISDTRGRPVLASLAKLRLADLRRRQGRLGESGSLLRELEAASDRVGAGHLVDAVRAAVALEGGKSAEAVHLAVRYMRTVPDDDLTERIDGLEVLVRAHLVADASGPAADAAAELAHIAAVVPTGLIRASASFAHGIVAASKGELTTARDALEEAHGLYLSSGTPFELAETSGELARVLSGLGSADLAIEHARSALRGFERLGAGRRREAAGRLLAQLVDAHGRRRKDVPLTPREIEVLRLVARGHSNDEIAAALYLSVRTVERHLSNIYAKIGAYGRAARAAAASYAHLHQLT